MASITTSPRIASRPLLVSQITPLMRPSSHDRAWRTTSAGARSTPASRDHLVRDALPAVGIEGRGEARSAAASSACGSRRQPQRAHLRYFVAGSAASSSAAGTPQAPSVGHALDHLHADAAHRDLLRRCRHVVEHQHHAARGEPAEIGVALEQRDRAPLRAAAIAAAKPAGPPPTTTHVGLARHDAGVAGRLLSIQSRSVMCGLLSMRGMPAPASARPDASG